MKKRRLWLLILLLSFALILSGGSVGLAQEDAGADSEEGDTVMLEEIIATGSRIVREEGFGQVSPVVVMGQEDISSFGLTRMEDILNTMPQLETSAASNAFSSNGATGTAALDLRGLSPERTLVLMNGRRMQPGGTNTQYVDINQIPSAMVERVEVLTGGASAIYGSDAVAGVVNFIMREVDGVELSLGASAYQHDNSNSYMQGLMDEAGFDYPSGNTGFDGKTYDASLLAGGDFSDGKGHATFYATYRKNKALLESERDYSSCALDATGTECGGSANTPNPNYFISPYDPETGEADYSQEIWVSLQPDNSLADFEGPLYNYAAINHFQRPDERWSAGGLMDLDINPHVTAYMEVQYFNDHSRAQIAESGTFFAEPYHLSIDNALFPDAFRDSLAEQLPGADMFEFWIGKRNVEGGPRVEIFDHSSFRIVGGVKGPINDKWDYDVSYLKGQTTSSSTYMNDFFAPAIALAVDAEACAAYGDCIPYEVFTYEGVTSEAAASLGGVAVSNNVTSIEMVTGVVSGDLGMGLAAGNINVAAGYEWREESFEDIRDYVYEAGLLLGQGGPRPSLSGDFNVSDLFGEADIPLLADLPFAKNLTANLALRWSDHNITGSATTYRAGLDWNTNDMLRFRTGYNRAVRSPNIEELFEAQYVNLWSGVDACAGDNPTYTAEQCARTGVTAAQYGNVPESPASQYNHMRGGNTDLEPEEADTFTLGVVVEPMKSLKLSLDYWSIEIDKTIDRIGSESAEIILDLCATEGQLCDLIHRSPGNGNLWMGTDVYIENTVMNVGKQKYEGIDFAGAYWLDALAGTWNFNMIGTYMLTKETTPIATDSSTTYDCVGTISTKCYPTPKWRHTASATYNPFGGFWSATARWRYFSKVDYDGDVDEVINLKATSYLDLDANFTILGKHTLSIGVNNVFDKSAPLVGDTMNLTYGNANAVAGFYDTLGRYFYSNLTFRF